MPGTGSCLCGNVKISYEGEPQMKALCHCADCHKITGSTFSTNIVVKEEGFKATGSSQKEFAKKADGGNSVVSHFCGNCGSTLYRDGKSFEGMKIIKVGVLDDPSKFENAKPDVELYAPQRPGWLKQVQGTTEKSGMS